MDLTEKVYTLLAELLAEQNGMEVVSVQITKEESK